ncbi:hypothetical protein R5W24_004427 [Gemmata sp. JC717]|uniref:hypothetical protein n=1 Tax=Gemmata algarum TaxID=2975278 RepID=UPI0021BB6523|nr:hypothetical protein [Gemmata algarum]MDY3555286.1 hypothetical protein [Gemmata algarum]
MPAIKYAARRTMAEKEIAVSEQAAQMVAAAASDLTPGSAVFYAALDALLEDGVSKNVGRQVIESARGGIAARG